MKAVNKITIILCLLLASFVLIPVSSALNWQDLKGVNDVKETTISRYWYYPDGTSRPNDTVIEDYRPASFRDSSFTTMTIKGSTLPDNRYYELNVTTP